MSLLMLLLLLAVVVYLFSQFGGKLAARNSLIWWLVFAFLMVAAADPMLLLPLAGAFGVQLVSNFVLATMIVFLLFQLIQQSAVTTEHARRMRLFVARQAARDFCARRPAASSAADGRPRVLVVLPCYNEEDCLPEVIRRLKALPADSHFDIDYCVVNDGSSDQSEMILKQQLPDNHVTHGINIGVAGVLMTGFLVADRLGYDYVVQCDSDGQHPIEDISALVREARERRCDLLIGSRFLGSVGRLLHQSTTPLRRIGSLLVVGALQAFRRVGSITDPTSGFRAYSRQAASHLVRFMPDEYPEPESIALLALAGGKIEEFPAQMQARQGGVSSLAGLQGPVFMLKVFSALIGLRLRSIGRPASQRRFFAS